MVKATLGGGSANMYEPVAHQSPGSVAEYAIAAAP